MISKHKSLVWLLFLFVLLLSACDPASLNKSPIGQVDNYTVVIGQTLEKSSDEGVLSNDSDPENDALSAKLMTNPNKGTLSLNMDGSFIYSSTPGSTGTDSFTYVASDGSSQSDETEVTLTLVNNRAPVAQSVSKTVVVGQSLVFDLQASDEDNDNLTFSLQSQPNLGSATLSGNQLSYTAGNATGTDSFDFEVNDGTDTDSATITITVTEAASSAQDDSYIALVNTLLEVSVPASGNAAVKNSTTLLTNDTASGPAIAESKATAHGQVDIFTDGSFRYVPQTNFVGQDSFIYKLANTSAIPNEATVTINVQEVNATDSDGAALSGNQKAIYVKAFASGGDGSSTKPYGTLFAAQSNSAEGDVIVLYSGTFAPAGLHGFELKNHQRLLGQGSDVVIDGEQVLAESGASIIQHSPAESLPLYKSTGSLNANNLVVQRVVSNITIKGITLDRANGTNVSKDSSAGSGSSGIVLSDKSTGTIHIEDVIIRYPGGSGISTAETDACLQTACTVPQGDTPGEKPVALHKLTIDNLRVIKPGDSGISSNDAISVEIRNSRIEDVSSKYGIAIESEHTSTVSVSNTYISTNTVGTEAFFFMSNNQFRNLPDSQMTISLSGNQAEYFLTGSNDTEAPAGVDLSFAFKAASYGNNSSLVMTGSSQHRNAEDNVECFGRDDAFNDFQENNPDATEGAFNSNAVCSGVSVGTF